MKFYVLLTFMLFSFIFSGCNTSKTEYVEKFSDQLKTGVYATHDSIQAGRGDLSQKYIVEVTRIVPPPPAEKRIPIKPLINQKTGKKYVFIPDHLKESKVIVVGSDEYAVLTASNSVLRTEIEETNKRVDEFKKETDQAIIDREKQFIDLQHNYNDVKNELAETEKRLAAESNKKWKWAVYAVSATLVILFGLWIASKFGFV